MQLRYLGMYNKMDCDNHCIDILRVNLDELLDEMCKIGVLDQNTKYTLTEIDYGAVGDMEPPNVWLSYHIWSDSPIRDSQLYKIPVTKIGGAQQKLTVFYKDYHNSNREETYHYFNIASEDKKFWLSLDLTEND